MLMLAVFYEQQIKDAIKEILRNDSEKFLYLRMAPNGPHLPDELGNDWTQISRVSVDKDDNIQGFMSANICRLTNTVNNVESWSVGCTAFAFDLKLFLEQLIHQFNVVRFSAVKDAPTDKIWTEALDSMKVKWKVCGVFSKYVRLSNGKVVDVKWFEVEGNGD